MDIVYCNVGSINLPGARTGRPVKVNRINRDGALPNADVLAIVPNFELDDVTAAFFGGNRLASYDIDFAQSDAKLIAIELQDLVNAVTTGSEVAVPGKLGLDAVALPGVRSSPNASALCRCRRWQGRRLPARDRQARWLLAGRLSATQNWAGVAKRWQR